MNVLVALVVMKEETVVIKEGIVVIKEEIVVIKEESVVIEIAGKIVPMCGVPMHGGIMMIGTCTCNGNVVMSILSHGIIEKKNHS